MRFKCLMLSGILLLLLIEPALAKPRRIVSINLCTDQVAMELANPEHIVSVSFLSADPISSTMVEEAKRIGLNHGAVEEILLAEPDLVLADAFASGQTVQLLKRLGVRVLTVSPASTIEEIKANYQLLGKALGEEARAHSIIDMIDASVAASTPLPGTEKRLIFTNYDVNGWISGQGTLLAQLVELAGYVLLGERQGNGQSRQLSLEELILANPDVIDLGDDYALTPSLGTDVFVHPAMKKLLKETVTLNIPTRYSLCGNSNITHILRLLSDKRRELIAL